MARKSKSSVDVDVNVKGKGTKKTTLEMKNLGKQTDKVSKSTAEANRNWKGASKQSSGASKNFSKMSQGMGGIVGAYATLAANIFAIGAAFRFLESAGDLQKLKEGQVLYASATGVALKSLTNDIIAATDAQIKFTDASQAAAIGKAAGLTNDQLVRLGKGAKDASIILGRDVTDSFNRLIRGVTKAEPELLDELGIILRLADASEKYGAMIGKSAQDLTQFEKSQAVTVEVLDQVESKYGRIMAVMEPSGNQFTQLGKAFDDIVNHIKEFSSAIATPIAGVLTEQPTLIIGILLALGNTLIKTTLTQWTNNAAASAENYKAKVVEAREELERLQLQGTKNVKALSGTKGAAKGLADVAGKAGYRPEGFKSKSWDLAIAGKGDQLSSQQLVGMKAAVKASGDLSKKMKNEYIAALDAMLLQTKKTTAGIDQELKITASKWKLGWKEMGLAATMALQGIQRAASMLMFALTKVLGWISLIATAFTLGKAAWNWAMGIKAGTEAVQEQANPMDIATEKVKALNEEFEKFNAIQEIIIEDGNGFLQFFEAMGNKIGQLGVNMQKHLLDAAGKGFKEFTDQTQAEFIALQNTLTKGATTNAFGLGGLNFDEAETRLQEMKTDLEELRAAGTSPYREGAAAKLAWQDTHPGGVMTGRMAAQLDKPVEVQAAEALQAATAGVEEFERSLEPARLAQEAMNGSMLTFMRMSEDEGLQNYAKWFDDMKESAELQAKAFGEGADNPITKYLEALEQLEAMEGKEYGTQEWKDLVTGIFTAQTAAQAFGTTITEVTRLQRDNSQEAAKLLQDVQKRSTEGRMVDNLQRELDLRKELAKEKLDAPAGMSEDEKEIFRNRTARINEEMKLFEKLDEMKRDAEKRTKATSVVESRMLAGKTKLVAARLKLEMSLMKNDDKRLKIKDEISAIEQKIRLEGDVQPQQLAMLENYYLELDLLESQNNELERKLDYTMQLKDAAAQAFESGLQKTFASFIKGEEKSLREGMLKLAQGVLSAVADTLAKQMTEQVMGLFGMKTEAQIMKEGMIEAAEEHVRLLTEALKADAERKKLKESSRTFTGDPVLQSLAVDPPMTIPGFDVSNTMERLTEELKGWNFTGSAATPATPGIAVGERDTITREPIRRTRAQQEVIDRERKFGEQTAARIALEKAQKNI